MLIMLRHAKQHTPPGRRLFPYTLEQYRKWLKWAEARLGVAVGWSPHSGRAGFASEGRAWGRSFTELREEGRWISDSSRRIYVDVATAAKISAGLKAAGLSQALAWALQFLPEYLSGEALAVAYRR